MDKILKKIGAFSIGPIVGAVISFITVPLITYIISPEEYGKAGMFSLAQSTVSTIVYLGMDQAFVREFNLYRNNMRKLLSNAMIIPVALVLVVSILTVVFNKRVSFLLFDNYDEFLPVFSLALLLPFMIIQNFALLKIRMEEDGLRYSLYTILLKCLILALTIILLLSYEKSFRSVVYAASLAEVINGTILYFTVIRGLHLSVNELEKPIISRMLKFGLPLVPAFAIGWILTSMDKVMLRTLCTYEELGLYTAAFKIVSVLSVLQSCFTLYWTPVAYRWYEEKKNFEYFELVSRFICVAMTSICLMLLLAKNLVGLVLGDDFVEAIRIFPFLLIYPVLYTVSETTAVGIGFKRKTKYNIVTSALSGGTNIIFNMILIPIYGGTGAAIATGCSYIVFFWGRTIISMCVWHKMKLGIYFAIIGIIVVNCIFHTFFGDVLAYTASAVSLACVLIAAFLWVKKTNLIGRFKNGEFV